MLNLGPMKASFKLLSLPPVVTALRYVAPSLVVGGVRGVSLEDALLALRIDLRRRGVDENGALFVEVRPSRRRLPFNSAALHVAKRDSGVTGRPRLDPRSRAGSTLLAQEANEQGAAAKSEDYPVGAVVTRQRGRNF